MRYRSSLRCSRGWIPQNSCSCDCRQALNVQVYLAMDRADQAEKTVKVSPRTRSVPVAMPVSARDNDRIHCAVALL